MTHYIALSIGVNTVTVIRPMACNAYFSQRPHDRPPVTLNITMPPSQAPTATSPCSAGRYVHPNLPLPLPSPTPPSPRFLLLRRWEQQQHSALARAILSMNLLSSNRGGDSDYETTPTMPMATTDTDASAAATTRDTIASLLDEALMIVDAVPRSFGSLQTRNVTNEETMTRSNDTTYSTASASSQSLGRPLTSLDYSPGPVDDRAVVEAVVVEETVEIIVEHEPEAEPDSN